MEGKTPEEIAELAHVASDAYQLEPDSSKRWPAVVDAVLKRSIHQEAARQPALHEDLLEPHPSQR